VNWISKTLRDQLYETTTYYFILLLLLKLLIIATTNCIMFQESRSTKLPVEMHNWELEWVFESRCSEVPYRV